MGVGLVYLLRQRENVHAVASAYRVGLGSHAYRERGDWAPAGRDGKVLAAVDRIGHGAANDL